MAVVPSPPLVSVDEYLNSSYHPDVEYVDGVLVERGMPTIAAGEVGYVGTHAVHTMMAVNINGAALLSGTPGRQLFPYITSDMNSYAPFGSQKYNALQTRFKKRIGWSNFSVAYTFAKALNIGDNGDSPLFRTFPLSYSLNKGLAGFDRT